MITAELLAELRALAEAASPYCNSVIVGDAGVRTGDPDGKYVDAVDPTTVLALLDRIAELEARDSERLPVAFEHSALVERIQQAMDYTAVDGRTTAEIVADEVLDFMPPPVRPDPEPPEVTSAVAEAQALLDARKRIAELDAKTSKLQAALADANIRCEMACVTPVDGCECAGCSFAAEYHAGIEPE